MSERDAYPVGSPVKMRFQRSKDALGTGAAQPALLAGCNRENAEGAVMGA